MGAPRNPKAVEIGARISEARHENGMTQRELADLLKLSERSVAAYETGEVIPYRYLKDLERSLGRPAAWFLHGEDAIVGRDEQLSEILTRLDARFRQSFVGSGPTLDELELLELLHRDAGCDVHVDHRRGVGDCVQKVMDGGDHDLSLGRWRLPRQ
jgi:transcriptional regulator with XRE-family HTH domain